MADPPPHIAARRREQRERRRRRRRAGLGGLAALAAAAGIAFVLIGAHGHRAVRRGRHVFVAETSKPRLGRSLAAVMAAGNTEIRKLIALGLPVYCGGPRGDELAFTFDDGPGVYTYLALRKLRQAHERATFFDVGKSINAFPGYLPRELRVGALGDHSYTHPDLATLTAGQVTSQLSRTAQLIEAESGQPVDLWRRPYEVADASVARIARRLGVLEVLWSVDSQDSLGANWARIARLVEAGLRPGAIIELHENRGQTIRALGILLPYLHRRHLRSVSLPELLDADPPSLAQLRRGWSGCGERASQRLGVGAA